MARLVALVAALAAVVGASVPPAAGETTQDQRDRIRRERAEAAAALDVLAAEDAQVDAALADLTADVAAQEASLTQVEAEVARAEEAVAAAVAAEQEMTARVTSLEGAMRRMAIQEYITGGRRSIDRLDPSGLDLGEWVRRNALADIAIGSTTVTENELREAREDLVVAREHAEAASVDVGRRRDEVAAQLAIVTATRDQQATFAARLDERIESRLAEAANLAAIDAQLSARIAAEQAALAARNPSTGRHSVSPVRVDRSIPLRTVSGITVHANLADNLVAMLNAAAAEGVTLSGWGYRDPQQQRALREAHCPDPVSSPAAACRPPTARPGHSMHERGLAVDFTENGQILGSASPGYIWLRRHGHEFGFKNLPSEPWHWSTNGR